MKTVKVGGSISSEGPKETYMGEDFFTKWRFFEGSDPTRGDVHYLGQEEAIQAGLVNATADRVFMGADRERTADSNGRKSVRVESRTAFNSGLFTITVDHIPTGCGTWPAFWMFGEDEYHRWPTWGEYDIIEGVHKSSNVITTLHTTDGCDQTLVNPGEDFLGSWEKGFGTAADNCSTTARDQWEQQGCSQRGPYGSMGEPFNMAGGGTFAGEWDPAAGHFRTWFWRRGMEPADLVGGTPDPDAWGQPYSYFSLDPRYCPKSHFRNMRLVIDLTFCGDLGNAFFHEDCGAVAKHMSCRDFVLSHPEHFKEAYWSVRDLIVYQRASLVEGVIDVPRRFRERSGRDAPSHHKAHHDNLDRSLGCKGSCASSTSTTMTMTTTSTTTVTPRKAKKGCKMGESVHCVGVEGYCSGGQCCMDGSTCPSASPDFNSCPKGKVEDCTWSDDNDDNSEEGLRPLNAETELHVLKRVEESQDPSLGATARESLQPGASSAPLGMLDWAARASAAELLTTGCFWAALVVLVLVMYRARHQGCQGWQCWRQSSDRNLRFEAGAEKEEEQAALLSTMVGPARFSMWSICHWRQ